MASSDYYWSRVLGFGRMWFLLLPRNANSTAGGASLLGSVVRDHEDKIFGSTGIFGKTYPEPNHLTTPQIILNAIKDNCSALGIKSEQEIIQEDAFHNGLRIEIEKKYSLKSDVANFPSLPISFGIDYSRLSKVVMKFGAGTVKRMIPEGYLSSLKAFYNGDDSRIPGSTGINISRETIVHQLLLTKQYSVTFESVEEFSPQTEVAIRQANLISLGEVKFELDRTTNKKIIVEIDDGNEYLIALNDIDWDEI